jgi:hypothetical protein
VTVDGLACVETRLLHGGETVQVWRDVVAAQRRRETRRAPVALSAAAAAVTTAIAATSTQDGPEEGTEAAEGGGERVAARVLYAEGGLAVIWKPRGMGTRGHHAGSLQCSLRWVLGDGAAGGGGVHMVAALEKRVAGLVVAAVGADGLRAATAARELRFVFRAVVCGAPASVGSTVYLRGGGGGGAAEEGGDEEHGGGVGGSGQDGEHRGSVAVRVEAAEVEGAEEEAAGESTTAVLSGAYCVVLATACDDDASAEEKQRTWSKVEHACYTRPTPASRTSDARASHREISRGRGNAGNVRDWVARGLGVRSTQRE